MSRDNHGRVIITWPAASPTPTALPVWGCAFEDPDTGEQLLDVVGMSMQIGGAKGFDSGQYIEVELIQLVDAEGNPIGPGPSSRLTTTPEYDEWQSRHMADADPDAIFPGQHFRTKTFRYIVAEMRIAASRPGVEPRLSVGARTGTPPDAVQLPPTVVPAWGDGGPTDQYGRALASGGPVTGGGPILVGEGDGCFVPSDPVRPIPNDMHPSLNLAREVTQHAKRNAPVVDP